MGCIDHSQNVEKMNISRNIALEVERFLNEIILYIEKGTLDMDMICCHKLC